MRRIQFFILFLLIACLIQATDNVEVLRTTRVGGETHFNANENRDGVTIEYQNGYDNNGVGTGGTASFICAARFTSDELSSYYDDYEITKVNVHIRSADYSQMQIRIWEGGSYGNPGSLVYSQYVTNYIVVGGWTELIISNPVTLNSGNEYWIGYAIELTGDHPCSVDSGPMVSNKGGWLYYNGSWDTLDDLGLNYNWCIQGILEFQTFSNSAPVVSNVFAQQRGDGSYKVDVYYNVYDADGDELNIMMQVSDDDGTTWDMSCNLTSGDIGEGIYSGNGKHIVWNVGAEHPNMQGDDFRFKITAEDGYTGGPGTVTDIDGNVYQTMIIGDQEWMIENLKVTHYNDGTPIPNVTGANTWTNLSTGAYCYYDNDPANADTYGALYNWYAVDDARGLAPEGWHIPSDEEIKELEMYLGMSQSQANSTGYRGTNEGSKLAGGYDLWSNGDLRNDPEFGSSGFSFLPGGYRSYYNGNFSLMGDSGYLWSSTESHSTYAWRRNLYYNYTQVGRDSTTKHYGFSVRCVRD